MTALSAPRPERGRRIPAIDALRGVAASLVVVSHLPFPRIVRGELVAYPWWIAAPLSQTYVGVSLFMVISGFCIHMGWARKGEEEPPAFNAFWRRRLHRLYPPYVVALLLSIGCLAIRKFVFVHGSGSVPTRLGYTGTTQLVVDLVLLLLLAQNFNGASVRVGNGPFWSLALEEQLYALYFPLLWLRRKTSARAALLVALVVTLLWRFATFYVLVDTYSPLAYLGPARWFEWTLGAVAVEASLERITLPGWCSSPSVGLAWIALALTLAALTHHEIAARFCTALSDPVWGLGFFTFINYAIRIDWAGANAGPVGRFFRWVGKISYSLYLTHALFIAAVGSVAIRTHYSKFAVTVACLVPPYILAWAFYHVVEKRFLNASRPAA